MDNSLWNLTVEQQFQIRLIEDASQKMSPEQLQEMLVQIAQMLMVKDNVIRDLLRSCLIH